MTDFQVTTFQIQEDDPQKSQVPDMAKETSISHIYNEFVKSAENRAVNIQV